MAFLIIQGQELGDRASSWTYCTALLAFCVLSLLTCIAFFVTFADTEVLALARAPDSLDHLTVAEPAPLYSYLCTVSEPKSNNVAHLPPDNVCDYLFYDSLYKNGRNTLDLGLASLDEGVQYFMQQVAHYTHTKFGFSFAPLAALLHRDYKKPDFYTAIDAIWNNNISHFGFLNLYREFAAAVVVKEALHVLKALHLHMKPKTSANRPSYYVLGLSLDSSTDYSVVSLMKTVFVPSLFVSIAHLSYSLRNFKDCRIFPVAMEELPPGLVRGRDYSYGHTVKESVAVLREVNKLGLSIPLAISFGFKGLYYTPKFADPVSPKPDDFELFKPCRSTASAEYDNPLTVCGQAGWTVSKSSRTLAYNSAQKRTITFLTERTIALLACDVKESNLDLAFSLAAYDVDYDDGLPCAAFGFSYPESSLTSFNRVVKMGYILNFLEKNYTSTAYNSECKGIPDLRLISPVD
ncbi:hypothetical protein HPB52_018050 [Rhipicephalus sanguineus]|uniref:Uncharacterized protein n=1 Tax=Rhipicephalus sanguineus TaxID=34632 RepID=A0A9D4PG21_RHISA|nr:hypothetical protein HPB52_018050 [Rhipicephalus sanguineus]